MLSGDSTRTRYEPTAKQQLKGRGKHPPVVRLWTTRAVGSEISAKRARYLDLRQQERAQQQCIDELRSQVTQLRQDSTPFRLVPPKRATIARWVAALLKTVHNTVVANGYWKSKILPTEDCIASASLAAGHAALRVFEGRAVNEND
ncbi:hypothetical protein PybrP1_012870 [[Pythium] brassicae (nom. inval.)]|nr:hypothetical protein PybrP1_012870 [[Pythium] brassicae (nom. inval.)]